MPQKKSKNIGCKISDDLFGIKIDCFYDPSRILQLSEFVWMLHSSLKVIFNNFLLIDATDI